MVQKKEVKSEEPLPEPKAATAEPEQEKIPAEGKVEVSGKQEPEGKKSVKQTEGTYEF